MRIDSHELLKQLSVGKTLPVLLTQNSTHQSLHLIHELVSTKTRAVPLEHGEFGVVVTPYLTVTKHLAQLVDGATIES